MAREILELKEHVDHVLKSKARELVDEKNLEITENFFYEPVEDEDDEESIDEISKKTLKSYVDKASNQLAKKAYSTGRIYGYAHGDKKGFGPGEVDKVTKDEKIMKRRQKGIPKATERLAGSYKIYPRVSKYRAEETEAEKKSLK